MPIPVFTGLPPHAEFSDVVRKINTLVAELRNLMLSLDTLNVVELDAEVIVAGSITADKIGAGEITANEIAANSITADKMNVAQLSAITANLGTITAGTVNSVSINSSTITGGTVQTNSSGNYPRVEMNSTDDMIIAEASATQYSEIIASLLGIPVIRLWDGSYFSSISQSTSSTTFGGNGDVSLVSLGTTNGDVLVRSDNKDVNIEAPSGNVYIDGTSFASVLSDISGKANSFTGFSGDKTVGAETWTFTNGVLTNIV